MLFLNLKRAIINKVFINMISIAMTTYNGERFLREQFDSILAQSVSDFEIVVCDDCSSDSTGAILQEYEKKDARIKAFFNERNIGFVKNFEKAVLLCKGDYIALADQDDIWKSNHLAVLLCNMEAASASVGNALIMDASGNIGNELLSDRDRYFADGSNADRLFRILFYGNPFQGTSTLYRRELFQYAFPIPEDIGYHDAWFAAFACCLGGLNYTFDAVTNYRLHGNNASGNHRLHFFTQAVEACMRKGWKTDRVIFCDELLRRIPDMNNELKDIVLSAKIFHENRTKGKRFSTIVSILKNYKRMYAVSDYKLAVSRCFGVLLRG